MKESGVDLSNQTSNFLSEFDNLDFDYVITVCGNASENCQHYPDGTKVIHAGFDDPPKLAAVYSDNDKKLECYRNVGDEIKAFVGKLPRILKCKE